MKSLLRSLDRTLLLMRDEFSSDVNDSVLLSALTSTRVALIADAINVASHAAQTAFVTTAMLMARSGHQVFLIAPDVSMVGPQPPLRRGGMISELVKIGRNLLPGIEFLVGSPEGEIDLAVGFGDTPFHVRARRRIRLSAEPWAGIMTPEDHPHRWQATMWPFGALAAAGLGAGEAFKIAMLKLLPYAVSETNTAALFTPTPHGRFELAQADAPFCSDLGEVDCVSGGAIVNSVLYCLSRIPAVRARGRIIEPDVADLTNLNRNMLLLRSGCGLPKALGLSQMLNEGLRFQPLRQRFDLDLAAGIPSLASTVIVGVDHIPTRWLVQQAKPDWLVVGATTHWSAMTSFHATGLGCARCLHYRDDFDGGLIPTTACVSFWAGLLSAVFVARHAAGQAISRQEQQIFLTPFRPEQPFSSSVAVREECPTCQGQTTKQGFAA